MTCQEPLRAIVDFLRGIGLSVAETDLSHETLLPGVDIASGGLLFDRAKLVWPGDLLHEAGHLAVTPAAERSRPKRSEPMEREVAAVAWSWAALRHLRLAPEVVFHEGGYRGRAAGLRATFAAGVYPGLPALVEAGLARADIYPRMERWLRD
jgi:hypothetical protein